MKTANIDIVARATELSAGPQLVRYQCLCGRKGRATWPEWERMGRECVCDGNARSYPRLNLLGHTYGRLTVVGWLGKRPTGMHHYWKVQCRCGNTTEVSGGDLRRQGRPTSSCGCLVIEWAQSTARKEILKHDLTGQRFGRLVAVKQLPARGQARNYRWRCRCECGNTTETIGSALESGKIASCGCWHYEPKALDISGKQFGHLTATRKVAEADRLMSEKWQCRCVCGKTRTLQRYQLFSHSPDQSCGCKLRPA